jgi:hypothetical protein
VLVGRVIAGDAGTPALVASVALAPLVALLGAGRPADRMPRARGAADAALMVALVLVLAANLLVVADVGRTVGLEGRWAVALGPAMALAVIVTRVVDPLWRCAMPLGVGFVLVPLVVVGLTRGAPWTAWADLAVRPALTFTEHSPWVTEARSVSEPTLLSFDEVHRVVAGAPSTLRVLERDGERPVARDWRLAAGEALTLRPGDELTLEAGIPLRFEPGRRIPGAPASGTAWADGASPPAPVAVVGIALTLVGGALALVPAAARPVTGTPAMISAGLLGAFVLGASLWGVYGIALVPEVTLTPRGVVSLSELGTLVGIPIALVTLPVLVAAGLVTLLVSAVVAWRARVTEVVGGLAVALGRPLPSRVAVTAGAAALALAASALATYGGDPWELFVAGLGVAAACSAAPRLARTGPAGEAAGAIVGAIVFVAILVAGDQLGPAYSSIERYPALAAAPIAWLVARVTRT